MDKYTPLEPLSGISLTILREAALLRALRHENVVQLHGLVAGGSRIHLLLELCCCNLRQHLRDLANQGCDSMDSAQLHSFSTQLLSAIDHCHAHRCLHRDIKPDNLLLDCSRRFLKLADFGMARAIVTAPIASPAPAGAAPQQTPGIVSAWYRSPELMLGDPAYGEPVDAWSAGCVVAEMVNLEPVFHGDTEVRSVALIHASPQQTG